MESYQRFLSVAQTNRQTTQSRVSANRERHFVSRFYRLPMAISAGRLWQMADGLLLFCALAKGRYLVSNARNFTLSPAPEKAASQTSDCRKSWFAKCEDDERAIVARIWRRQKDSGQKAARSRWYARLNDSSDGHDGLRPGPRRIEEIAASLRYASQETAKDMGWRRLSRWSYRVGESSISLLFGSCIASRWCYRIRRFTETLDRWTDICVAQ